MADSDTDPLAEPKTPSRPPARTSSFTVLWPTLAHGDLEQPEFPLDLILCQTGILSAHGILQGSTYESPHTTRPQCPDGAHRVVGSERVVTSMPDMMR